jgi:putative thioredoxin
MAGAHVIDVDESDFESGVIETSRERPIVVDFWAGWCQPCLILGPVLERLADEHGGAFLLAKLDVDASPTLASRYGVKGIPAVKAFRDGHVVSEFVGAQPEQSVRRFIQSVLPSAADEHAAAGREAASDAEAEAEFREALAHDPAHPEASAGLAALLLDRDDIDGARSVLAASPPTPLIRRLQAEIDLRAAAGSGGELGEAARAALRGDPRGALDRSLAVFADGNREAARELMVRLFAVLGDEDPLTKEYRGKLANALY